jgi:membrane associated rhomboid family serine protease
MSFPDDWKIAFESESKQACSDRALVLHSLSIPYEIVSDGNLCLLVVPEQAVEKAKYELWQYETENRQSAKTAPTVKPVYQDAVPGVVAYVVIVIGVAWLAGEATFGRDWFAAGRIDGTLIRDGEWWRSVTALTLHSGLRHLAGNIGFGVVFGVLAGSLAGPGVAWLAIVLASAVANLLNTLLLDSTHRAIGASTAVFAALGVVAGFSWRAKLMSQERWAYRLGPIVGGFALLAYTGTGDENTDIGAHLLGFVCGFGAGMLLTRFASLLPRRKIQFAAGITALTLVIMAWIIGLRLWALGS